MSLGKKSAQRIESQEKKSSTMDVIQPTYIYVHIKICTTERWKLDVIRGVIRQTCSYLVVHVCDQRKIDWKIKARTYILKRRQWRRQQQQHSNREKKQKKS